MPISDWPSMRQSDLLKLLDEQGYRVDKKKNGSTITNVSTGQTQTIHQSLNMTNATRNRATGNWIKQLERIGVMPPAKWEEKQRKMYEVPVIVKETGEEVELPPEHPEWITIPDAAKLLGITPTYMNMLFKKRNIDWTYRKKGSDGRLIGLKLRTSQVLELQGRPKQERGEEAPPPPKPRRVRAPKIVAVDEHKLESALEKLAEAVTLFAQSILAPRED